MGFGELEGEATVVKNMFGREVSLVSAMLLDVPVSPVKCSPSTSGKAVYAHRSQHCGPGGVSCLLCMLNAHWLHRLLTMQSVPCSGSGAFFATQPVCCIVARTVETGNELFSMDVWQRCCAWSVQCSASKA
jgi:hypothetical protein